MLDEIEKAHPDVFNILLQVLEDGRLTDSKGRTVDFRNTIIIMTSNIGAAAAAGRNTVGFGSESKALTYERMREAMMGELKKTFSPEFLNRIDEIIVFHPLEQEQAAKIVRLMLKGVADRLRARGIDLTFSEVAVSLKIYWETVNSPRSRAISETAAARLPPAESPISVISWDCTPKSSGCR